MSAGVELREAATVVITRQGDDGLEVLLLLRSKDSPAFPEMWVFPGGTVSEEDRASGHDARRAAGVREVREECGLEFDQAELVELSEWMPPASARHRFRTTFYTVQAPAAAVVIDDFEVVDHAWVSPADALERHARSEWDFLPPTWVTLARLAHEQESAPRIFHSQVTGKDPTVLAWGGDEEHHEQGGGAGDRHRITLGARPWIYEDHGPAHPGPAQEAIA